MANLSKFLLTVMISSISYFGLISSGWLREMEYKIYDQYVKLCSKKNQDEKIVIVALTEEDIVKIGHFPVSDEILGNVLLRIREQNPRVMGLDFHRNVKTGGSDKSSLELALIYRNTPNLIGVQKTTGDNPLEKPILPHPELKKAERAGASEIIQDKEGKREIVRRSYLYLQDSNKKIIPSFGLVLASKYLEKENIKFGQNKSWLNFDNIYNLFPPLRENWKFYSGDSIDNYQILINYCSSQKSFKTISFSRVLSEDFSRDFFEDKIVLLGAMSPTVNDIFRIPHQKAIPRGDEDLTFGVEIHGYLASFLINYTLNPNQEKLLNFLPILIEYSILSLLLLGGSFVLIFWLNNQSKKIIYLILFSITQVVFVVFLGVVGFLHGWWIPVISYIYVILIISLTSSFFIYIEQLKQENSILEEKVKQKAKKLEEAYKKIAAQEKIIAYQELARTLSHEIKNQTNIIRANAQNCYNNLLEIKQIIDENYFLFDEDSEEEFINPSQLSSQGLEKLVRIDDIVNKVTSILQEFDMNTGRENLEVNLINLNELLKTIVDESTVIKPVENLKIENNFDNSLICFLGVVQHIERAFENIILNACDSLIFKSSELKNFVPILELVTKDKDNFIEIRIKDNGKGIALENQGHIFDLHWSTKSEIGGKGLGLYFARNLIREHGGDIEVESKNGEYAEFIITLPKT